MSTDMSLLQALRNRRSRRFCLGMEMADGPMAYQSKQAGVRLTEEEEAMLAFAACGITGSALGELVYTPGGGGTIMAGMLGRTIASGDAICSVTVFVSNADATFMLKRPQDHEAAEISEIIDLGRGGRLVDLYRRSRIKIGPGGLRPPLSPLHNLAVNRWSLYDPSSTYFLPVNDLTLVYINGVLEILDHQTSAFLVDERNSFRPAGIGRFAASRGGHLDDDPRAEKLLTIQQVESLVTEFVSIEQGMILQNLALMTEALGLGGFPHWAAHPYGWLETLGFDIEKIPASRYLGMNRVLAALARILGRDPSVGLGTRLRRNNRTLLAPYCPPEFSSMRAAVEAVVELKFGSKAGIFRGRVEDGAWKRPQEIAEAAQRPSQKAVAATIAFCEYVYQRYRRFPAYQPPLRTILGFQVGHVDSDFYDRFYQPGALGEAHRHHFERWHGSAPSDLP